MTHPQSPNVEMTGMIMPKPMANMDAALWRRVAKATKAMAPPNTRNTMTPHLVTWQRFG